MSGNQHVLPSGDRWAVRRVGATRPSRVFPTQREAIVAARGFAQKQAIDLFIHGIDGRIEGYETYKRATDSKK